MTPREFHDFLRTNAFGEENAFSAKELGMRADFLAASDRELRELAEEAAREGLPVCSSNRGYYIPKDKAELFVCVDRLEGQAKAMLARVSFLKKAGERVFGAADLFPQTRGA